MSDSMIITMSLLAFLVGIPVGQVLGMLAALWWDSRR